MMKTTCVLDIACQLRSNDVVIVDQDILDHLVKTEAQAIAASHRYR